MSIAAAPVQYSRGADPDTRSFYATTNSSHFQDPKVYTAYRANALRSTVAGDLLPLRPWTMRDDARKRQLPALDRSVHDFSGFSRNYPQTRGGDLDENFAWKTTYADFTQQAAPFDLSHPNEFSTSDDCWADNRMPYGGFKSSIMKDPYRHPHRSQQFAPNADPSDIYPEDVFTTTFRRHFTPYRPEDPRPPAGGKTTVYHKLIEGRVMDSGGDLGRNTTYFDDFVKHPLPHLKEGDVRKNMKGVDENGFLRALRKVELGRDGSEKPLQSSYDNHYQRAPEGGFLETPRNKRTGYSSNVRTAKTGEKSGNLDENTEYRDQYLDYLPMTASSPRDMAWHADSPSALDGFTRAISTKASRATTPPNPLTGKHKSVERKLGMQHQLEEKLADFKVGSVSQRD